MWRTPSFSPYLLATAATTRVITEITKITIELMEISGTVTEIKKGGRVIHLGDKSAKISGSRTKLTIGGKPDDRGNVTVGMNCEAELKGESGSEAKTFACN